MKKYKVLVTHPYELDITPCVSTGGIPLLKRVDMKGCYISHPIQEIPDWIKNSINSGIWGELEMSVVDTGRKTKKGNPVYKVEYTGYKNIIEDWVTFSETLEESTSEGERGVSLRIGETSKIKNAIRWRHVRVENVQELPVRLQSQAKAMLEAFEWNKNNPRQGFREEIEGVNVDKYLLTTIGDSGSRYVKVPEGTIKRYATRAQAEVLDGGEWGVIKKEIRIEYKYLSVKLAPYPNPNNLYTIVEAYSEESVNIPIELWSVKTKEEFIERKEVSYQESHYKFDFWDKFDNERGHFEEEWKKRWVNVFKVRYELPDKLKEIYKGILPLEIEYKINKNI